MTSAAQCILLLACVAICSSAAIVPDCQCVSTIPWVHPSQIASVRDYLPRPYCRRHEVIVTLKDKTIHCLDPEQPLTKRILERRNEMQKAKNATKTKTASAPATASATAPASVPATASATAQATPLATKSIKYLII